MRYHAKAWTGEEKTWQLLIKSSLSSQPFLPPARWRPVSPHDHIFNYQSIHPDESPTTGELGKRSLETFTFFFSFKLRLLFSCHFPNHQTSKKYLPHFILTLWRDVEPLLDRLWYRTCSRTWVGNANGRQHLWGAWNRHDPAVRRQRAGSAAHFSRARHDPGNRKPDNVRLLFLTWNSFYIENEPGFPLQLWSQQSLRLELSVFLDQQGKLSLDWLIGWTFLLVKRHHSIDRLIDWLIFSALLRVMLIEADRYFSQLHCLSLSSTHFPLPPRSHRKSTRHP